ncbi:MAG: TatD family hydrolase [Thermoplasmata archaeon]|nr:TatD family hydrolase [Thermoplasmata archaeon]MCI4341047.1 TatD family hydrolase [Thermoplasmata archaeon]
MPLPADLPVVDHHCHLSPTGEGVAAVRRFAAAGGTHLFLATQNYLSEVPVRLAQYEEQYATTVAIARQVEEETSVRCYSVLAPYPVDLLRQVDALGVAAAVELQMAALALAGKEVAEGRAVALGEVGRPHFPYPPELADSVEAVFRRALDVARDAGCPAVVHCEELDAGGFRSLAALASAALFPLQKLVKHYHRTALPPTDYAGISPSYLARRELVDSVLSRGGPWFLETDFLDDPRRPGAVLDLATVPRRARALADRDPTAAERLRIPFVESIGAVYGFTPEVPVG